MGEMGLQGVIRGKTVRTTVSDKAAPCPLDHATISSMRPRLIGCGCPSWLRRLRATYVATWAGFVYVA